jgi:hypothetical protein
VTLVPREEELESVREETRNRCVCEIEIKGNSYAAKPVTVFTVAYAGTSDQELVDLILRLPRSSDIPPEYGIPIRAENVSVVSWMRYDF